MCFSSFSIIRGKYGFVVIIVVIIILRFFMHMANAFKSANANKRERLHAHLRNNIWGLGNSDVGVFSYYNQCKNISHIVFLHIFTIPVRCVRSVCLGHKLRFCLSLIYRKLFI
jgi:hypothetical protein